MTNKYLLLAMSIALVFIQVANCYHTINGEAAQGIAGNTPQPFDVTNAVCRDPNGEEGVCKHIKQCPTILKDFVRLVTGRDETFIRYIQQSNAICQKLNNPVICCPLKSKTTILFEIDKPTIDGNLRGRLLTPEEGCGLGKPINRPKIIFPGFRTRPGVYPWIALFGYENNSDVSLECGGSMITTRHILTSAHCVNPSPSFVRLGVFDINSSNDEKVHDVKVLRSEQHPEYNEQNRANDIAILFLEQDVNFTERIRPICLPVNEPIRSRDFVNYNPFIAAWLRFQKGVNVSQRNVMRDWQLMVLENAECERKYKGHEKLLSGKQFGETVMCAANIYGDQVNCQFDSGLMQPIFNEKIRSFSYFQTGISSYGIGCSPTNTPPIYTRVQHFIDWIQEKIGR